MPTIPTMMGSMEHGTGVMREAAGEGGNGSGIGVCPNVPVIPLRVGDSFITDGGRVAEAIAYAADMQAVAATLAVGALSNSEATTAVQVCHDMVSHLSVQQVMKIHITTIPSCLRQYPLCSFALI